MPFTLGNLVVRISPALFLCALVLVVPARSIAQSAAAPTTPTLRPISTAAAEAKADARSSSDAAVANTTIVIGFLGGHVDRDNTAHVEVQLADKLRAEFGDSITAETFENRHYTDAYNRIVGLLDADRDGHLSAEEKHRARIILYGHSWGAAAVVALARRLRAIGIPVCLTIQVDSVSHFGQDDSIIPPNVAKAVNFYQPQGHIHGESVIRPDDPAQTQILGNFRFDYSQDTSVCPGYPWWDRYFMKSHIQIECDPKVWSQVESLIRAELPRAGVNLAASAAPDTAATGASSSAKP